MKLNRIEGSFFEPINSEPLRHLATVFYTLIFASRLARTSLRPNLRVEGFRASAEASTEGQVCPQGSASPGHFKAASLRTYSASEAHSATSCCSLLHYVRMHITALFHSAIL